MAFGLIYDEAYTLAKERIRSANAASADVFDAIEWKLMRTESLEGFEVVESQQTP